ncbi:MAG: GTP-binding protein [Beijerinckiaceae bacterium]
MNASLTHAAECIPFTVLGGFLGAGKTTLINHLLRYAAGRYAVLVNDFGAINVDAGLIAEHSGETLRLTNGCVCCSLTDDFLGTLIRVLDAEESFEHIFVEASGVGDPWAIAEIALVEPQLTLNAIIVLADAERIASLMADARIGETVARQIRAADLVLLNKSDLADAAARRRAEKAVEGAKPGARILETIGAAVPIDVLDLRADARQTSRFRAESTSHEESFRRLVFQRNGRFNAEALAKSLDRLPPSLLRLKGFGSIADAGARQLLQWVGGRWSLTPMPEAPKGDWEIELVGIGTADLDEAAITRALESAILSLAAQDLPAASPKRKYHPALSDE